MTVTNPHAPCPTYARMGGSGASAELLEEKRQGSGCICHDIGVGTFEYNPPDVNFSDSREGGREGGGREEGGGGGGEGGEGRRGGGEGRGGGGGKGGREGGRSGWVGGWMGWMDGCGVGWGGVVSQ